MTHISRIIGTWRIAPAVEGLGALLVIGAIFTFHARWIFGHFSNDGYLCDSGWLAYLFAQADPLLHNPKAVVGTACAGDNASTFLAHHLSPHIFLFAAPFKLFGASGIDILAYHQGFFFALFFVALYLIGTTARLSASDRYVLLLATVPIGTLGNALLQAAAYPHYETAMFAVSSLGIAACFRGYRHLFACCLLGLLFIREDGGLYAAVVCLSCLAVKCDDNRRGGGRDWTLAIAGAIGIVASVVAFLVKAKYFPGFDAFSNNFAGNHWNHVTHVFVLERAQAMLANWNIAPVLAGSIVLAVFDRRYVTGIVVLAPLFLVHILSVRPEHGYFSLYYALPWLLPVLIWVAVLVSRISASRASVMEKGILVVLSLTLTAPVQAIIGTPQQRWYVAQQAFTRPVVDIAAMTEFVRWVRANFASPVMERGQKQCASMGIAALVPDDLTPQEVIDPRSDISECRTLLLLRSDMHYIELSAEAKEFGFKQVAQRENAELWIFDKD